LANIEEKDLDIGRRASAFDVYLGRVNLAWVDGANASNFPLSRQLYL
jgi:hypothetical protein